MPLDDEKVISIRSGSAGFLVRCSSFSTWRLRRAGSVGQPVATGSNRPANRTPRIGSPPCVGGRFPCGPVDVAQRDALLARQPRAVLVLRGNYRETVAAPTPLRL